MLTTGSDMGHSDGLLPLTAVVLEFALVAVRVAIGAAHRFVVFGTKGTFAHGFPIVHLAHGSEAAHVPFARVRVVCEWSERLKKTRLVPVNKKKKKI